jgi:indolepyruvate ferredoxin oxidoreductase beta subunit
MPAVMQGRGDRGGRVKMNKPVNSVLLVGVGGQGIIRASDILSFVLMKAGYDVKKSEVHGMAQRGGCVSSYVRYGSKVYSPLAMKGDVDVLVSFENLETLRYLDYLKPGGTVVINSEEIYPPSVNLGEDDYPKDVEGSVRKYFSDVKILNAFDLAVKAGNWRMANTVILGVLSLFLDIKEEIWLDVLKENFPEKLIEGNITAFNLGMEI